MTRIPEPGRVKTRLIPALGAKQAAAVHEQLLRHMLNTATNHAKTPILNIGQVAVEVRYAGDLEKSNAQIDFSREQLDIIRPQQGANLGAKISNVIDSACHEGATAILVTGTDCPDLSPAVLEQAWQQLEHADVVFGPAFDGGYYLVGLKRPHPELFAEIDWGTEHVLNQSLARCRKLGLSTSLLSPLSDVDEPEDLVVCRRLGKSFSICQPGIQRDLLSVIVPTLNEAHQLEATLQPVLGRSDCEILVADGGSSDGTVALAERLGCRVVCANRGRGRQMNAGAALARGETLLFLHADTRLPEHFRAEIDALLSMHVIGGAFRLQIDAPGRPLRWVEWGANLRSRILQLPYGDQALFLRAEDFYRLGGFQNWPMMEDFEFSRRLKRFGRIKLVRSAVSTSGRRWQRMGVLRTTIINQLCVLLYLCGVSPQRLAQLYTNFQLRKPDFPSTP